MSLCPIPHASLSAPVATTALPNREAHDTYLPALQLFYQIFQRRDRRTATCASQVEQAYLARYDAQYCDCTLIDARPFPRPLSSSARAPRSHVDQSFGAPDRPAQHLRDRDGNAILTSIDQCQPRLQPLMLLKCSMVQHTWSMPLLLLLRQSGT